MKPKAVRLFARAVRALLPGDLVDEFGDAQVDAFEDLYRRARSRGVGPTAVLVVREIGGLLSTALRERLGARSSGHDGPTDLRRAARVLLRQPGFTGVVVATLAIGTAATSGIFSVANGVLLRPLPYRDADRLAVVWALLDASTNPEDMTVTPSDYLTMSERARGFSGWAAHNLWSPVVTGDDGDAERLLAGLVTPNLFDMMGVTPALGRTFRADDGAGGDRVVLLSHGFWVRRFGGAPDVVGKPLRLNGVTHSIVGVLPADYRHPDPHRPLDETQLFVPFDMSRWRDNHGHFLRVVARLAPGTTFEAAERELDGVIRQAAAERPPEHDDESALVLPLRDEFYGAAKQPLLLAMVGGGLLFLLVCANVGNLVLARMVSRRREFALRTSLGAPRGSVLRQLVMESAVLAGAGGALGLGVVLLAMGWIRRVQGLFLPLIGDIRLDATVVAFALLLAFAVTLILGALPHAELRGLDVTNVLKEGTAGGGSRLGRRVRSAVVVAEVALAAAIVLGAGVLGQAFLTIAATDPGFDPERLLTAELSPPEGRYAEGEETRAFYRDLRDRFLALPEATAVAYASGLPMVDGDWLDDFEVVGRPRPAGELPLIEMRYVSPAYFETMGAEVAQGREFLDSDRDGALPVVVVNREAARILWGSESPLGERVRRLGSGDETEWEVVGVVSDILDQSLSAPPDPFVYFPFEQRAVSGAAFVLRSDDDPAALAAGVRRIVREADPEVVVDDLDVYARRIDETIAAPRLAWIFSIAFSGVAIVLAGLGIFGVLSYSVRARTREIGIRSALGARARDVKRLVVRQSLTLTGVGLAIGMLGALAGARSLSSVPFAVARGEAVVVSVAQAHPLVLIIVPLVLSVVGLLASWLPTRRALGVEAVEALRWDG